jgi:hypothetical protein
MNLSPPGDEPSGMHAHPQPPTEEMKAMLKRYASGAAATLAAVVATLAGAVAILAGASPALADTPGFAVKVTQTADTFTVGKGAHTLSAVVSTSNDRLRNRCIKVRWALTISTQGVSLDQVRVTRVENGGSVPVQARFQGEAVRVVDQQVDPGQLCRNQNDTAQWAISFTGPDNGSVDFAMQALSQQGRVLATGGTSSRVITPVAAKPSRSTPTPSATESSSPEPTESFSPEPTEAAIAPVTQPSAGPAALPRSSNSSSVLLPGILVGAVLVFVGVALLLRLRMRSRRQPAGPPAGPQWQQQTETLPTGFYNMPRRRE